MLGRLMPLFLLTGTVATAATQGPATVKRVTDAVLVILQRSEIQEFARILQADATLGSSLPKPGHPEALAAWLQENAKGTGGRDVTLDRWDNPYRLERDGARDLTFLSLGPNGSRDTCVRSEEATKDDDDICETIEVPRGGMR